MDRQKPRGFTFLVIYIVCVSVGLSYFIEKPSVLSPETIFSMFLIAVPIVTVLISIVFFSLRMAAENISNFIRNEKPKGIK